MLDALKGLTGSGKAEKQAEDFQALIVRIPTIVNAQSGHRDRRFWAS